MFNYIRFYQQQLINTNIEVNILKSVMLPVQSII